MWLTEPSSKEKRRTSSPIMELINSSSHWDTGDKDSIINKEEMEFRRVSLFDVSKEKRVKGAYVVAMDEVTFVIFKIAFRSNKNLKNILPR